MTRVLATVLLGAVLVVSIASPAAAEEEFLEPAFGVDTGPPGWFVAFFVLALFAGVGVTIYKVTMARDLARGSGMDPDRATAMTLLEDDGLAATYLAANLRPSPGSAPAQAADAAGGRRSVSERLAELNTLLEQGLVTQAEYDARRAAILDSL
jgi:hypothetical protein